MFTHKHTLPRFIKRERERTSEQITAHETFQIHTSQATSLTSINVDGTIKGDRFICSGDLDVKPLIEQKSTSKFEQERSMKLVKIAYAESKLMIDFFSLPKSIFSTGNTKNKKLRTRVFFIRSFLWIKNVLEPIYWASFEVNFTFYSIRTNEIRSSSVVNPHAASNACHSVTLPLFLIYW